MERFADNLWYSNSLKDSSGSVSQPQNFKNIYKNGWDLYHFTDHSWREYYVLLFSEGNEKTETLKKRLSALCWTSKNFFCVTEAFLPLFYFGWTDLLDPAELFFKCNKLIYNLFSHFSIRKSAFLTTWGSKQRLVELINCIHEVISRQRRQERSTSETIWMIF